MRIVIIGGTGLIGSKLVSRLLQSGHEAIAASRTTGVDTLSGEGLAEALRGADVAVDVSNPSSFEGQAAMDFFENSTRHLLEAEATAGVGHHVTLSAVGTERLSESAYFRAKIVQEYLVARSGLPFTIVHATQFFEFLKTIVDGATVEQRVRLAPVSFRPMAADDVAKAVARVAVGRPLNRMLETAGPETFRLDQLVRGHLSDRNDPRDVVTDGEARYFGARLTERTLMPDDGVRLGEIRFEEWRARLASLAGKPPRQERATAELA